MSDLSPPITLATHSLTLAAGCRAQSQITLMPLPMCDDRDKVETRNDQENGTAVRPRNPFGHGFGIDWIIRQRERQGWQSGPTLCATSATAPGSMAYRTARTFCGWGLLNGVTLHVYAKPTSMPPFRPQCAARARESSATGSLEGIAGRRKKRTSLIL
jgi:hypothetical protein